jgi:hypothetical protein
VPLLLERRIRGCVDVDKKSGPLRLKTKLTCFMMATQDCSHFCCCSCSCMALREAKLRGKWCVEGESTVSERAHCAAEGGVKSGGSVPMRFLRARLQCSAAAAV